MRNKQLSYAPADIRPIYCGAAWPLILQSDLIKKQILLLCYDQPKSISELSEELQTGYEYIQDAVSGLCKKKMMEKTDGKYLTTIPMFHLSKNYEATAVKNKYIWEMEIPKKIVEITYNLKDEITALNFYGNNFDIKYLNWIFFVMMYNLIQKKIRSYFISKTDEIVIDNYVWRTQNMNGSVMLSYKYADEHPEENAPECEKRVEYWSTYYMHIGDIGIYNVFDAAPFPDGVNKEKNWKDYNGGRNGYITKENLSLYLNLVKNPDMEIKEKDKKNIEEFLKHGVIVKEGNKYKPMIPCIPKDIVEQIERIISKGITPIIKEIVTSIGDEIEKILLPCLGNNKSRKDHFYSFWICDFLNPREELFWYGMNVDGLEIPKDYNQSVAGMWIVL